MKRCLLPALITVSIFATWQGFNADYIANAERNYDDHISSLNIALAEVDKTNAPVLSPNLYSVANGSDIQSIEYPSDAPSFKSCWTLEDIKALSLARNVNTTSPVIVAVLDTGIDKSHEELIGRVMDEINLSGNDAVDDICGHGTSVAGIIAADADNGLGITGIAPESLLLNVKVADDSGRCRILSLSEGIIWAVEHGARVINISIEFNDSISDLKEAVDYAWDNGAVIIAAAGNDGDSSGRYPAFYDNCVAVTAVRGNGELAPLANYGDWVDVAAPGYRIYTLSAGDSYDYKYGTSFATAYVSGLASILFSLVTDNNGNGRLNDEVREAIETGYYGTDYSFRF